MDQGINCLSKAAMGGLASMRKEAVAGKTSTALKAANNTTTGTSKGLKISVFMPLTFFLQPNLNFCHFLTADTG
ncbi:MAG: hypothetical protein RQ899_08465 [Pseudomonadales bacterium]|nr:hypothetical protein [Pseudomonadales bacterium]